MSNNDFAPESPRGPKAEWAVVCLVWDGSGSIGRG